MCQKVIDHGLNESILLEENSRVQLYIQGKKLLTGISFYHLGMVTEKSYYLSESRFPLLGATRGSHPTTRKIELSLHVPSLFSPKMFNLQFSCGFWPFCPKFPPPPSPPTSQTQMRNLENNEQTYHKNKEVKSVQPVQFKLCLNLCLSWMEFCGLQELVGHTNMSFHFFGIFRFPDEILEKPVQFCGSYKCIMKKCVF